MSIAYIKNEETNYTYKTKYPMLEDAIMRAWTTPGLHSVIVVTEDMTEGQKVWDNTQELPEWVIYS